MNDKNVTRKDDTLTLCDPLTRDTLPLGDTTTTPDNQSAMTVTRQETGHAPQRQNSDGMPLSQAPAFDIPTDTVSGQTWTQIVDYVTQQLSQDDLPDKVIHMVELMLAGYPTYKVAKELGVKTEQVRYWLSKYPIITAVLQNARQLLIAWRLNQLEQQFVQAVKKSEEILNVPLYGDSGVNTKALSAVGVHARYIIDLFVGKKLDVDLAEETVETLRATRSALDYITDRLAELQDGPVDGVYRVIDKTSPSGPVVNENGDPLFGEMGVLALDEDGAAQCHICGEHHKHLSIHIRTKHKMSVEDYEILFLLRDGEIKEYEQTQD